ncbi:MAG: DUF4276 family protein [Isosphaeraceae bacterium]|nr:DUF4276 family protein [Isosphaeraceae bacterium]
MKRITPIVEGHGEVMAFPKLLYRLIGEAGADGKVTISNPIRIHRSVVNRSEVLRKSVQLAARSSDAILILVDSDDDCPAEKGPEIARIAQEIAGSKPCSFVFAHREYEAWFLAAVDSLALGTGTPTIPIAPDDPEAIRGVKEKLSKLLGINYAPTTHQDKFSSRFDLATAHRACRSFRKLVREFGEILARLGMPPGDWPPGSWGEG